MIMLVVAPVALLLAAGGVFFGFFDGAQWLADATKPARVNVVGQVIFNGEPLSDAIIETRPVKGELMGAIGAGDDKGAFKLVTQIRGDFLEGAYVGEHQVTVKRYDTSVMAFGPPPLLTPSKYASFQTSPLRITVKKGQTDIVLELSGDVDAPAAADPRAEEYGQRRGVIAPDAENTDMENTDTENRDVQESDASESDVEKTGSENVPKDTVDAPSTTEKQPVSDSDG